MKGASSFPSLVLVGCVSFGLSLAFPFVFRVVVLAIGFFCPVFEMMCLLVLITVFFFGKLVQIFTLPQLSVMFK
jgi:hypothetical protein